jgi:hypothetical protein
VGYAISRARNNNDTDTNMNTNYNNNYNNNCIFARARQLTRPVARVFVIICNMASSAAPVAFITPTVSSKPSRRAFRLKVGYASSRAHSNNDTNTNINANYNSKYNNIYIFARARHFARARQQHQSLGFS